MGGLNLFLFYCDGSLILNIPSETFGQSRMQYYLGNTLGF